MRRGIGLALLVVAVGFALPASAAGFGPLSSVGTFGGGAGELEKPYGVAFGLDGASYVAEYGNDRISVFAPDGTFLRAFGKGVHPAGGDICNAASGCGEGLAGGSAAGLAGPKGIAFGPEGNLFVVDSGNNRVAVYAPEGVFIRAFGKNVKPGGGDVCTTECQAGEGGEGAGELSEPTGIAFDGSGRLYVADHGNNRVDVRAADGTFLRAFGLEVAAGAPGDVCTEVTGCEAGLANGAAGSMLRPLDVTALPGDLLAVADEGNHRIDLFTAAGAFVRASGDEVDPLGGDVCASECQAASPGDGAAAFSGPGAVAAGAEGGVYVADSGNDRIVELDATGGFVRAFGQGVVDGAAVFQICDLASGCQAGSSGLAPGAASLPFGIAVDCAASVHVAEQGAGISRVERFGEPGAALPPCSEEPAPVESTVEFVVPPNRFRFAGLRRIRSSGRAIVFVRIPGPGRLTLYGRGVRRLVRVVGRARRLGLPVRPKRPLLRYLRRRGRARIRVKVSYRPFGGFARTLEKPIVLLERRKGGRR